MPYQLMQIKPGIVKDITKYSAGKNGPFWVDGDLVRFKNGYAEKIGGWLKEAYTRVDAAGSVTTTETALVGIARTMVLWRAITDGEDRIAIGTHNHLYILENDALYDITPLRKTTSNLTNPLKTTDESTTIIVTDNSHGAISGDFVVINSAAAIGGITAATLNQSEGYQITVLTANTYSITVSSAATSTVAAGGGTTIDIKYLIGVAAGLGQQSGDPALGWGTGSWGGSTWGTARSTDSSDVKLSNSQWSLNLWGEDLIATVRGGAIYYYDTSSSPNRAVLVSSLAGATSVPTTTTLTTISFPDRHVLALGTDPLSSSGNIDPMQVRWSDQEDFAVWAPTVTNTAGDQRLEVGTKIVSATTSKDETVIATDEALYGMTFVGPPFIFSFRLLATNCGSAGKNVMMTVDSTVFWMGRSNFFVYDGIVKELPCSVQHFVFDRMQKDYIDKSFAAHNKEYNEVSWFYVSTSNSAGTANPEPDSYVTFNYQDQAWSIGSLNRTVWSDAFGVRNVPFAFDENGLFYNHETGTTDNGSAMDSFVESSSLELFAGDNTYMVDKIVPDVTLSSDTSLSVTLKTRKYPNDTDVVKGPFTITSTTQKVSTRAKGRQMAIKIQSTGTQDEWSLGDFRFNARQDGMR